MTKSNLYRIFFQDANGINHFLAETYVCGRLSKKFLEKYLIDKFWDERLTSASCIPVVERVVQN